MSGKGRKVFIVGVGMTKFEKPGRRKGFDYQDFAKEAGVKALVDANLTFDAVEFASVGYCYGDSTCGQRAVYQLGMTQIPLVNVNNNCSTGSTAIYLARQAIEGGLYDCAMAMGFEKMFTGSLKSFFTDRTNPGDWRRTLMEERRGIDPKAPPASQTFGNAAIEYMERYGATTVHLDKIAQKNHAHSGANPYSQFQEHWTLKEVQDARMVFKNAGMTVLHCCPTSDGAGACILASEEFVKAHGLEAQAVEICAQVMATDSVDPVKTKNSMDVAGFRMTQRAAKDAYKIAGITPKDVGVVELHDCFSANELITYDALQLCAPGEAHKFVDSGAAKLGGAGPIVNVSGGLISKGHPLGATGLAQTCELVWQLRGWCGPRQVPNLKYALGHNVGLGGAVVVSVLKKAFPDAKPAAGYQDPRERFGYNPALEARMLKDGDLEKVIAKDGALNNAAGLVLPAKL